MVWKSFIFSDVLTEEQRAQLAHYKDLLISWNKRMNLTAIVEPEAIESDHFFDSIALSMFLDFNKIESICDIGSGAGFPGVPLKIMFPHLQVILLEVRQKRIEFLQMLCVELGLTNIQVCSLDWRSFLRTNTYHVDLFCARASLHPEELIRVFKSGCHYCSAKLVYWASESWQPDKSVNAYIHDIWDYEVRDKKRKYILFQKNINEKKGSL